MSPIPLLCSPVLDYDADTSKVPYILPEFNYFFETAYDVTSFGSCALDRPSGSSGEGLMMIVNHFLDVDILGIYIPDVAKDSSTNAATGSGSIGEQADLCISTWGRSPNLILVDNFNVGWFSQSSVHLSSLLTCNRGCLYSTK